jgi:hypothetical protein
MGYVIGSVVPAGAFERLRAAPGLVAMVATAGPRGPDVAPVSLVRFASAGRVLLGLAHDRTTLANVRSGSRAAISVILPPDVALTVAGDARVVAERLTAEHVAAVEVAVDTVKDDRHPAATLLTRLEYRWEEADRAAIDEALLEDLDRL